MRNSETVQNDERISVVVADPKREVQTGLAVCLPAPSKLVTGFHPRSGPNGDPGQEGVAGPDRAAVVDCDGQIVDDRAGKGHVPGHDGPHRRTFIDGEVHAPMAPVGRAGCEAVRNSAGHRRHDAPSMGGRHQQCEHDEDGHRGTVLNRLPGF